MNKPKIANALIVLLLCAATALALWPGSPAIRQAISRDSGVFLYTGWRILEGEVPYKDIWDHKTPGIFYMDALGLALEPGSLWGVWGVEFVFACTASILLFLLLRRLFGIASAALAMLLILFNLSDMLAGGNLTQIPALSFQAGGLWLAYNISQSPSDKRAWFWLGVLAACTMLFRQNSIGIFAAAAAWLLLQACLSRKPAAIMPAGLAALAGFLAAALPVLAFFALQAALEGFWDAAFVFNFIYSAEGSIRERFEALAAGLQYLGSNGLVIFLLTGFGLAGSAWLPKQAWPAEKALRPFLQYLTIAVVLEVLLVVMSGRPRLPYFIAILPVAALLAGYCFWRAEQWLIGRASAGTAQVGLALAALIAVICQYPQYENILRVNRGLERPTEVITYILEHTDTQDEVLLVGAETSINFETRRQSPTRFVYQYPLYRQAYAQPAYLEEFFEDVLASKPALIILTTGDPDIPNRFGGSKTARSEELAHKINQLYQPVKQFENGWMALAPLD